MRHSCTSKTMVKTFFSHTCVADSLQIRCVCMCRVLFVLLRVLQQKSGICVCSATQAEHGAGGLPHGLPDFAATQNTAVTSFLPPIPGPSRPVADTSPITHVFPPHQSLGGTVNERRVNSAARATIRNRGGIPSPASPPKRPVHVPYRSNGRTAQPHLRQNPPLKLTVLFLPLYVSTVTISCSVA